MINHIIVWSIKNRVLVLLLTLVVILAGGIATKQTPVDALPDLSDVQVIVKASYAGQSPQVVQEQITYPLTTALMSVPGAKTVRGFSFYGDAYIYVIFDDNTETYWARSRVLEYLNQVKLPQAAQVTLGPDATGVGWVYLYALQDTSGQHDLAELTSLQNWLLKLELQGLPGVSEVATVGGMVKQYQIEVDPLKLRAYQIPLSHIKRAIEQGNQQLGASVIEMAEAEYMLTATGYLQSIADIESLPLGVNQNGTPLQLKHLANVRLGPAMRRGIAELNGQGETVGGVIVMRYGENAAQVITKVKDKLTSLQASLPDGVEIVPVYDRSQLINNAVDNLWQKLIQELLVVGLICAAFLYHLRSSLIAMISLPIGILGAFILIKLQGLNANIMSLGGIAIAIGAMIDGAIVMIENLHKHIEQNPITDQNRWQLVSKAATEVGPALFFSLLIITVSFLPVFTLEAQEGRLFAPLAYTKTYAMAVAAVLAITLIPVLMGYFIRGHITPEQHNPINRGISKIYLPSLKYLLDYPKTTLLVLVLLAATVIWPIKQIGTEFMPELDEGDLMYMPTTYPGLSIGKARELLQQTDKLISTVPEVASVFGKIGRAETATDPAPLTMIETFIQLKPKAHWRDGMTTQQLKQELDSLVNLPGVSNAWVMPIKTRIDMLATGIKTPVGIKIAGAELKQISQIGQQIEQLLAPMPGTASVYAERVAGGRYIRLDLKRQQIARFGLSIEEVQTIIASAIGGRTIAQTIEGLERYPINLRYPQHYRNSPEALARLPILTSQGQTLALADLVDIRIEDGPAGIKSENARINGWVFIDIEDSNIGDYVTNAQSLLSQELSLPAGYSLTWSGQFEYIERAKAKLSIVMPITLAIIVILLYLSFRRLTEVALILLTLPLALVGSFWLLHWLHFELSIAVGVGFIALAGVAVEIGVIMLVYLNQAQQALPKNFNNEQLKQAIMDGAGRRIRPVLMTAMSIIIGLLPVLLGTGTGAEVMSRIAAPMVGGMASALLLTLVVLPLAFYLTHQNASTRQ